MHHSPTHDKARRGSAFDEARLGGHQIQLNSVDLETLKRAQEHPEDYERLVVRIWGWSAYFTALDKCYQDHVMQRQIYSM